jgi:DNA polymerase-1
VVPTGRLSSINPNLQNIPIRTEEGGKIRKAFIPATENHVLLSADYSQIELRILAHFSQDPNMISAFQKGEDIHQATASLIFDIPLNEVTKEQRYKAKTVNFGIIYGQSAFGLSETLSIPRSEAKAIIDAYYEKFPTIRKFMDDTIHTARETGIVITEFGRIRPLPEINDRNPGRRQFAERVAVNTRMQGTAADIIKLAMVKIQHLITEKNLQSKMLLQVHDELVFDVLKSEETHIVPLVKETMESVYKMSVPLLVDTAIGNNWGEAS